jgi:hypothetical protein
MDGEPGLMTRLREVERLLTLRMLQVADVERIVGAQQAKIARMNRVLSWWNHQGTVPKQGWQAATQGCSLTSSPGVAD